ncbi:MAG: CapA family protein [Bacteroidota bacterium]
MKITFPSLLPILLFFLLGKTTLAQPPSDSISTIDLLFIGDVMGHRPQIKSAQVVKNKQYNYEPCFQYVKPIVEKADLAIANLEVTLPGEPPYVGYPAFRSPDELAAALRNAGFDVLVTANNHSNDSRKKGVIHTIDEARANGFYQTGTFKNMEERALFYPLLVYKNDFKLVFLNYTYGTNSIKTQPPTFVNYMEEELMEKDMEEAHQYQPDAIIVVMHWGKEYQLLESKKQNQIAKKLFDWGADLIIGMHPHVVQPIREMEILQSDSTFKKTLVTYSLGNFISNQTKPNTDGGLMFEITLEKNKKTNQVTLGAHHYIPIWRYIHQFSKQKKTYYAVPISAFENGNESWLDMSKKNIKAMKAFATTTRNHLKKFDSSERKIKLQELGDVPRLGKEERQGGEK